MITNKHIDRLLKVQIVQDFITQHAMKSCVYSKGEKNSLLIYKIPYVVEICDTLIENYLEISLANIEENTKIFGFIARDVSLKLGYQDINVLRARTFDAENDLFLSWKFEKQRDLNWEIEALDKLFPEIILKGLKALDSGSFNSRLAASQYTLKMYDGLKETYLACCGGMITI